MIETIRQFYENSNIPKPIINKKLKMLERNSDIASEFEDWIKWKIQDQRRSGGRGLYCQRAI